MQPIGNYLPDFGKRLRIDRLEDESLYVAKKLKELEKRLFNLENKGQCE